LGKQEAKAKETDPKILKSDEVPHHPGRSNPGLERGFFVRSSLKSLEKPRKSSTLNLSPIVGRVSMDEFTLS
jgi:hypothetical protein